MKARLFKSACKSDVMIHIITSPTRSTRRIICEAEPGTKVSSFSTNSPSSSTSENYIPESLFARDGLVETLLAFV